jgi:hypothetical protein
MYHCIPDFPSYSFLEICPPLVVSTRPSMVVLPSWFFPGPPSWWYSLVVFHWPSMVVLPSWFLPGPPSSWFLSGPRGGTPVVVSPWPSVMVLPIWLAVPRTRWLFLMVLPYGPSLSPLRNVSLAVPRSCPSWYLPLSRVPTFFTYLLPSLFLSVVLPCCPVMLHMNYNSIVFETSAKVQNFWWLQLLAPMAAFVRDNPTLWSIVRMVNVCNIWQ